jgi:hypothetical protein
MYILTRSEEVQRVVNGSSFNDHILEMWCRQSWEVQVRKPTPSVWNVKQRTATDAQYFKVVHVRQIQFPTHQTQRVFSRFGSEHT